MLARLPTDTPEHLLNHIVLKLRLLPGVTSQSIDLTNHPPFHYKASSIRIQQGILRTYKDGPHNYYTAKPRYKNELKVSNR